MKTLMICLLCCLFQITLLSHPVIWKGGYVINTKLTNSVTETKTHYSISNKWALGLHGITLHHTSYAMLQSNNLLKRWNSKGSQGNLYLFSAIGTSLNKEKELISHLGIQADWETRKIYTQISLDSFLKEKPVYILNTRLGFAPYLTTYDGLSTWIILQSDTRIEKDTTLTSVIPVIRLFKDNILLEMGSNLSSRYFVTIMIHF